MFPRLALLPIGLFLLWCVVCQQWYVCHIKFKCGDTTAVNLPPPTAENQPLVFAWSSADPETGPSWQAYRDSLTALMKDDKLLEIVGLYTKAESPPDGFANMGLARATKVKDLLLKEVPGLDPQRIVVTSRLMDEPANARTAKFVATQFGIKDKPKADAVEITEVDNTITILFPYAQTTKEADPRVDEYLEKLANRLKQTDETVQITGHTDNVGEVDYNQQLGLDRAKHIQAILVSKGVAAERLSVASKGKLEPVADNNTTEGSRLNRRAVLVLNKKRPS